MSGKQKVMECVLIKTPEFIIHKPKCVTIVQRPSQKTILEDVKERRIFFFDDVEEDNYDYFGEEEVELECQEDIFTPEKGFTLQEIAILF